MTHYKPKHLLPKLEVVTQEVYTFNISPSKQFKKDRLQEQIHHLVKILSYHKYNKHIFNAHLYPELSPFGRFHWHGRIQILEPLEFYLLIVPKLLERATVVIKPIEHNDIWHTYETKQLNLWKKLYPNQKLPIIMNYKPSEPEVEKLYGFFPLENSSDDDHSCDGLDHKITFNKKM